MGEEEVTIQAARIALKCDKCGEGFKNMAWTPGMTCPKCGSDTIAPAPIIEGAVDYSIANRSKGYAIEDIRFGKIAQWADFITPFQYNQALARQKQIADSGQHAPHIAQALISQKTITPLQMKAVLEVYEKPRPDADDREFVQVATQNKFVTQEQGAEALQQQRDMKKQNTPPPVSVLMFEKRMMKENQIIAILKAQHKRLVGPIHEVNAVLERHRPPTILEKYIGKKGDPMRKYWAAAYITVGTLLLLAWMWYYGLLKFTSEKIPYYCENCHKTFIWKAKIQVPIKCGYCGKKAAVYGYFCEKCRRAYGLPYRLGGGPIKCTHKGCNSMEYSQITPERIEELERRTREEQEADQRGVRKSDIKVE